MLCFNNRVKLLCFFNIYLLFLILVSPQQLVPDHIVLTAQEKSQVLEKYMAKDQQLPRLMTIDPVARYYGLKRGQVVKIVRESKTAGRYVAYRLVQ